MARDVARLQESRAVFSTKPPRINTELSVGSDRASSPLRHRARVIKTEGTADSIATPQISSAPLDASPHGGKKREGR
ncbi:hypothetical protein JOB18_008300 [Solea senegalensis]|uniref:Uncharacterized protein n=1 Tax=Solea senegalensis TaxID=28829 RepID=A0AAV6RX35_SOLSE|nr:hypothetical protein JOB18_008300 [Solea senegalensis]